MTLLVFGKTGQVAQHLFTHPGTTCLSRGEADLADPQACAMMIHRIGPRAVINAAAYTAVDRAEEEEALATTINGAAPGAMAEACAILDIPFVTISTDYIFDGSGDVAWKPNDAPAPLNAYGRSKLAGEQAVVATGGPHAILRTSWVFTPGGKNFVVSMLRLGTEHKKLSVVADQVGGPTPASAIAGACITIAEALSVAPDKSGIYHFSGAPDVSWAEFARTIFADAGIRCTVEDLPTADYPTPALRPLNSRLACAETCATFSIEQPDWRANLPAVVAAYRDHGS